MPHVKGLDRSRNNVWSGSKKGGAFVTIPGKFLKLVAKHIDLPTPRHRFLVLSEEGVLHVFSDALADHPLAVINVWQTAMRFPGDNVIELRRGEEVMLVMQFNTEWDKDAWKDEFTNRGRRKSTRMF